MVTLEEVARAVRLDVQLVRQILAEMPGLHTTKLVQDKVFKTARKLGYDFKKLKIGKRLHFRKEVVTDLIRHIEAHPDWGRAEIIRYLHSTSEMVSRVQKQAFKQEFS
ncbi:MAG: hypothetical protein HYY93_07380 [Planctomycetes bacterium]|nr:hypothetical protein [Planctomycetota bacterium]